MSYRLLRLADKYEKKANDTILCIPLFLSKFADRRTYEQDASATCAVANIRLASHSTSLPPSRSLSLSMSVCLRLCLDIAACRNCGRLALLQATPAHLRAACVSGIQIPVGHDHLRRNTVDEDVVEMKEENVVEMKEEDVVEMKEKYVNMWYR